MHDKLNRRDILKFGAGLVAGVGGSKLVDQKEENKNSPGMGGSEFIERVAYKRITNIAYFQSDGRIEEKLAALKDQIIFDGETGDLRMFDEQAQGLERYIPPRGEVARLHVSSNGPFIIFEYSRKNGTTFGVTVWRNIEDGRVRIGRWDTVYAGQFDVDADFK